MATLPIQTSKISAEAIETVLVKGDLSSLKPAERVLYYQAVCESLGLNPLTQPFAYIQLNGKLTLYAKRDCTDQLRQINNISISIAAREVVEGCYIVTAQAKRADGRSDESIGAVPIDNLKGEARSNAMMKAESKAKRRVTLSLCGLALLDESEVSSVNGAVLMPPPPTEIRKPQPESQVRLEPADKSGKFSRPGNVSHANVGPQPAAVIAEQIPEDYEDVMAETGYRNVQVPYYEEVELPEDERSQLEQELADSITLMGKRKEMLDAFGVMKNRYAAIEMQKTFYGILKLHGVSAASEFKPTAEGQAEAVACFAEMRLDIARREGRR